MKCVLALFALVAVAAAAPSVPLAYGGYGGYAALGAYGPSAHAPAGAYGLVTYPNGAVVPADEPAVVAARADHLKAKAAYGYAAYAAPVYGAYH